MTTCLVAGWDWDRDWDWGWDWNWDWALALGLELTQRLGLPALMLAIDVRPERASSAASASSFIANYNCLTTPNGSNAFTRTSAPARPGLIYAHALPSAVIGCGPFGCQVLVPPENTHPRPPAAHLSASGSSSSSDCDCKLGKRILVHVHLAVGCCSLTR
ncbi:hypothetical protein AWZ03_002214 [Drosophila navojoa]|uniref:Uncharacterized protein n=1 Tax=Drosophila navojoa TaxID=7232 RepID=A0A484BRJ9_DRONA|nr:hypothetical protein AWZ03_002214 [Drosophila navojoa]